MRAAPGSSTPTATGNQSYGSGSHWRPVRDAHTESRGVTRRPLGLIPAIADCLNGPLGWASPPRCSINDEVAAEIDWRTVTSSGIQDWDREYSSKRLRSDANRKSGGFLGRTQGGEVGGDSRHDSGRHQPGSRYGR